MKIFGATNLIPILSIFTAPKGSLVLTYWNLKRNWLEHIMQKILKACVIKMMLGVSLCLDEYIVCSSRHYDQVSITPSSGQQNFSHILSQ